MRLLLLLFLLSCSKEAPNPEVNPFPDNTGSDTVYIRVEPVIKSNGFGRYLGFYLHTSQPMPADIKFYFRVDGDTVAMLMPYKFRTWYNGTSKTSMPNDIKFIRADLNKKIVMK